MLLILAGLILTPAMAGTVWTTDGRQVEGTINLADGQVLVQPPTGQIIRIAAGEVRRIVFGVEETGRRPRGALPVGGLGRDVGTVGLVGSSGMRGGALSVIGSGEGIDGKADAFCFAYQPRLGDVEIVAKLARMQTTHQLAQCGLMLREGEGGEAKQVSLLIQPSGVVMLLSRRGTGESTIEIAKTRVELPVWLKLTRSRGVIWGQWSVDGGGWQTVGRERDLLGRNVLAGLASSSHNNGRLNAARFEEVGITGREGEAAAEAVIALRPGVELIDGTALAGVSVEVKDDDVLLGRVVGGSLQKLKIKRSEVARLIYRPVTDAMLAGIMAEWTGTLLRDGDFFGGRITALNDERLTVDSLLYGIKTFSLAGDVMVVCLHEMESRQYAVEVRGRDGTRLMGDRLKIEGNLVVVDHPAAGKLSMAREQIEEVVVR